MAMATYRCTEDGKERFTFTDGGGAASITLTLPEPGPGLCWVIDGLLPYTVGTVTSWNMQVNTEGGGATIALVGGLVGVGAVDTSSLNIPFPGPIVCPKESAVQCVLATNGAGTTQLTVLAHLALGAAAA
jgi:hypothetical protein